MVMDKKKQKQLTVGRAVDIETLFQLSDLGGISSTMFRDAQVGSEHVVRIKGDSSDTAITWRVRINEVDEEGCAVTVTPLEAMEETYASDIF